MRTALALVAIILGQFRSTFNVSTIGGRIWPWVQHRPEPVSARSFHCAAQDDVELLSRDVAVDGPTGDTRMAVVFRTNKKRLLAETAQRLNARLQGMEKPAAGDGAESGGAGASASRGAGARGAPAEGRRPMAAGQRASFGTLSSSDAAPVIKAKGFGATGGGSSRRREAAAADGEQAKGGEGT